MMGRSRPGSLAPAVEAGVTVPHPHVVVALDVMGGSPMVRGTPVPVRRLWAWHRKGVSVETLVKRYPILGWPKVLDALAFAYDNEDLIEDDLARERALLGDKFPPRQVPIIPGIVVESIAASTDPQRTTQERKDPDSRG